MLLYLTASQNLSVSVPIDNRRILPIYLYTTVDRFRHASEIDDLCRVVPKILYLTASQNLLGSVPDDK